MFAFLLWAILALMGSTMELSYLGSGSASLMNNIINAPLFTSSNLLVGVVQSAFDPAMWTSLIKIFLFDFSFFVGTGGTLTRFMLFIPIGGSIVAGIVANVRPIG
jgi:hypothetical protein